MYSCCLHILFRSVLMSGTFSLITEMVIWIYLLFSHHRIHPIWRTQFNYNIYILFTRCDVMRCNALEPLPMLFYTARIVKHLFVISVFPRCLIRPIATQFITKLESSFPLFYFDSISIENTCTTLSFS